MEAKGRCALKMFDLVLCGKLSNIDLPESSMNVKMSDRRISGSDVVSMMHAAKSRHGDNTCTRPSRYCSSTPSRSLLFQSEMRPVLVVVADIFIHQPLQMAFVENDEMVE